MKLWLDDFRLPPDETWIWCKTADEAISCLQFDKDRVTEISLDHDLGHTEVYRERTGYDVATWIENMAASKMIERMKWSVHSANPYGAKRIRMAMESADKYWNEA